MIHSNGPRTHVLGRLVTFRNCTKTDNKLAELVPLTHKFAKQSRIEIFPTNGPELMPLMPLMHKFAKLSRVRIFRNKHARSTPL
jgi:hypothetical protein